MLARFSHTTKEGNITLLSIRIWDYSAAMATFRHQQYFIHQSAQVQAARYADNGNVIAQTFGRQDKHGFHPKCPMIQLGIQSFNRGG